MKFLAIECVAVNRILPYMKTFFSGRNQLTLSDYIKKNEGHQNN